MKATSISILLCILLSCISCQQNKTLFDAEIVQEGDFKNLSYYPKMDFELITDSAYWYFDKKERNMFAYGSVSKGNQLYKSNKFKMIVLLRTYRLSDTKEHEVVLRTFSKDFKTIDSYVIASTLNNVACNGSINNNLEISTTCEDGVTTLATVDEYGKFIKQ
jgi:hypothetical protein